MVGDAVKHISKLELALYSVAAMAFASLLYAVNGAGGLPAFAFCLCVSAVFVSIIASLLASNRTSYSEKALHEGFIEYLYRVAYYRAGGGSYLKALEKASQRTKPGRLKAVLEQASKKHRLGGNFLEHIKSLEEFRNYNPVSDSKADPNDMITSYSFYLRERQSQIEETAQRYATFNMFISTIAPSFLVFAFVGNAILSQTDFSMLLFSVSLLLLIPIAYSVGNMLMRRRLLV